MVYILEVHPSDVWQMASNVREHLVFASPRDMEERRLPATTCSVRLGIKFPALLDDFQNSTEAAYTGWPDRIHLIDAAGRIAYKSRAGPFGFQPEELSAALAKLP